MKRKAPLPPPLQPQPAVAPLMLEQNDENFMNMACGSHVQTQNNSFCHRTFETNPYYRPNEELILIDMPPPYPASAPHFARDMSFLPPYSTENARATLEPMTSQNQQQQPPWVVIKQEPDLLLLGTMSVVFVVLILVLVLVIIK